MDVPFKGLLKFYKINQGLEIIIKKGIPPGSGIGSSAASAAAAARERAAGRSSKGRPSKR